MDVFQIADQEFIELHNLLKVMGLCSTGGSAKTAIAEGRVTVDGKVEIQKRCKIRRGQVVEFQGRAIMIT
jgi:ribosome-associated protein